MFDYKKTIEFWNKIFEEETTFEKEKPLEVPEIEEGLSWLVENNGPVLDFGCGNGKMLLRAVELGASRGVGIDISPGAIDSCNKLVKIADSESCEFHIGGMGKLRDMPSDYYSGVILSNIIDNMLPDHAKDTLRQVHRLLNTDGGLLLKLNPYIEPKILEEWKAKELESDFYLEENGLYLWNLSDEKVVDLTHDLFEMVDKITVHYKPHDHTNRLYYMKKR